MKKFLLSVVVLLFAVSLFSAPLPIGGKVEDISLDVWYKNKKSPALEALGKKYIAILFVTTAVPDPLMLGRVEKMAEELKKKNVEIFFVSNGLPKNSTDVPAWKNLSIPVAFDLKSKLFNTLGGHFERIPFWAVITPQKQLAWRGKVSLLPALINELQSGKYKVADAARRETFTVKLTSLIKAGKYLEAVNAVTEEQKFEPKNMELVGIKCNLLFRRLKNPEAALKEADKAIAANPKAMPLYDFKLRLQRKALPGRSVLPIFKQMAEQFKDSPSLLIQQCSKEMALPIELVEPEGLYLLARTAASAQKYKNKQEQGGALLAYARILHYCGRPDLAAVQAQKAEKLLSGKQKKSASAIRKHSEEIFKLSKKIK